MSEDTTQPLPPSEERIMRAIAELRAGITSTVAELRADMNGRFDRTDEHFTELDKELAATRQTRPIWQEVLARVTKIDSKFDVVAAEMLDQRADIEMLKKRLPPAA